MNVKEELRKIKFASLSLVREELLRRILSERKVQREFDRELDSIIGRLDTVTAPEAEKTGAAVLQENDKIALDMLVKIYDTQEDLP